MNSVATSFTKDSNTSSVTTVFRNLPSTSTPALDYNLAVASSGGGNFGSSPLLDLVSNSICVVKGKMNGFQVTVITGSAGGGYLSPSDPPFFRLDLGSIALSAGVHRSSIVCESRFQDLSVTYLNLKLGAWEPLVETCGFGVLVSLDAGKRLGFVADEMRKVLKKEKTGKNLWSNLKDSLNTSGPAEGVDTEGNAGQPKMREVARKMTAVFGGGTTQIQKQILQTFSKDEHSGGKGGNIDLTQQLCLILLFAEMDGRLFEEDSDYEEEGHEEVSPTRKRTVSKEEMISEIVAIASSARDKKNFYARYIPGHGDFAEMTRSVAPGKVRDQGDTINVCFKDTRPLNINLTTAFLERFLVLRGGTKEKKMGRAMSSDDLLGSGVLGIVAEEEMREPYKIHNHLPVTVEIQVGMVADDSIVSWINIGEIECGDDLLLDAGGYFKGRDEEETFEVRLRFPSNTSQWASWSEVLKLGWRRAFKGTMGIVDINNVNLDVGVDCRVQPSRGKRGVSMNKGVFNIHFSVPYWIVNATRRGGRELLFRVRGDARNDGSDRTPEKGRRGKENLSPSKPVRWKDGFRFVGGQSGIDGEHSNSGDIVGLKKIILGKEAGKEGENGGKGRMFEVLMVDDEECNEFGVKGGRDEPWSRTAPMRGGQNFNVKVTPSKVAAGGPTYHNRILALCSSVVVAPKKFGGDFGTKLLCICDRYALSNLLGRELEVKVCRADGSFVNDVKRDVENVILSSDGVPIDFHFNDSGTVRIRPTEYGWGWSGAFKLKRKRSGENAKEITFRMCNELSGKVIVCSVDFKDGGGGGISVTLRNVEQPPFRIENHTLHPLNCQQAGVGWTGMGTMLGMGGRGSSGPSSAPIIQLLPYNSAVYAWDDADRRDRRLVVETAKRDVSRGIRAGELIGEFKLDKLAPNCEVKDVTHKAFEGEIRAEGPSRVLRITDAMLGREENLAREELSMLNSGGNHEGEERGWGLIFKLHLSVVGVSVVDGSPQELMYLRTDGVALERMINSTTGEDSGGMKIRSIGVDNQLWITPFPAMVRVGKQRESGNELYGYEYGEETNAVEVGWTRDTRFRNDIVSRVTLVRKMTVRIQPVEMNIDGNLIIRAMGMAWGMRGWGGEEESDQGRDNLLGKVMGIKLVQRERER